MPKNVASLIDVNNKEFGCQTECCESFTSVIALAVVVVVVVR
jgi:hypothetical protein